MTLNNIRIFCMMCALTWICFSSLSIHFLHFHEKNGNGIDWECVQFFDMWPKLFVAMVKKNLHDSKKIVWNISCRFSRLESRLICSRINDKHTWLCGAHSIGNWECVCCKQFRSYWNGGDDDRKRLKKVIEYRIE